MAKLTVKQIHDLARGIIKANPGGIRSKAILDQILVQSPETPANTIWGALWSLATKFPGELSKPSRGLFKPVAQGDGVETTPVVGDVEAADEIREQDFYDPFAEWLKSDLDEATTAVGLGGAGLQKKWGTPDVIGAYKPLASHRIKFDLELISAEIKADPQQPVVAFGQAAAYRLFSAKSYVVMPDTIAEEDYSRLEALCMLYGIGLVLFKLDPKNPDFTIRVRAQRFLPDMFYVNEFADRLYQLDAGLFNQLLG